MWQYNQTPSLDELYHWAKGGTSKNHKWIERIKLATGGYKYIYKQDQDRVKIYQFNKELGALNREAARQSSKNSYNMLNKINKQIQDNEKSVKKFDNKANYNAALAKSYRSAANNFTSKSNDKNEGLISRIKANKQATKFNQKATNAYNLESTYRKNAANVKTGLISLKEQQDTWKQYNRLDRQNYGSKLKDEAERNRNLGIAQSKAATSKLKYDNSFRGKTEKAIKDVFANKDKNEKKPLIGETKTMSAKEVTPAEREALAKETKKVTGPQVYSKGTLAKAGEEASNKLKEARVETYESVKGFINDHPELKSKLNSLKEQIYNASPEELQQIEKDFDKKVKKKYAQDKFDVTVEKGKKWLEDFLKK